MSLVMYVELLGGKMDGQRMVISLPERDELDGPPPEMQVVDVPELYEIIQFQAVSQEPTSIPMPPHLTYHLHKWDYNEAGDLFAKYDLVVIHD